MSTAASALDRAVQLVDEARRNPVLAVKHAETIGRLLRQAQNAEPANGSQLGARENDRLADVLEHLSHLVTNAHRTLAALGVTGVLRPGPIPALSAVRPDSGPVRVDWPALVTVRSMFVGTTDGDPLNLSRVSMRLTREQNTGEFGTTGNAPAYIPLLAFQSTNRDWFRLRDMELSSSQSWTAYFHYEGAASGPPEVTPFLLFGFTQGSN